MRVQEDEMKYTSEFFHTNLFQVLSSLIIFLMKVPGNCESLAGQVSNHCLPPHEILVDSGKWHDKNTVSIRFPLKPKPKDNTILVYRLVTWMFCAFLRIVWGGGKGEGYSLSVRASI